MNSEWKKVNLGEIGEISSAGVDKKIIDGEQKVRLVNYLDAYNRDKIYSKDLHHVVTAPSHKVKKCSVKKGDVFFTPSSETSNDIGISAVAMEDIDDATYSYHVVRLRPTIEMDLFFTVYAFKTHSFLKQATRFAAGSGQRYVISQDNFRKIEVLIPPIQEQKEIADTLLLWDFAIEKIESLIKLKQKQFNWLVKTSFSSENSISWQSTTLGDLFNIHTHKSKSSTIDEKGKNLIVDMGAISIEGKLIARKKTNSISDFLNVGDLVMPKDDIGGGNIIGKVAIIDAPNKYICGDHVYRLVEKGNNNPLFLRYMINSHAINKRLRACANGTSQLGLNKRDIIKQKIKIPAPREQEKIANTLNTASREIELLQQLAEKYQLQKQGLMQKLLMGT